MNTRTPGPWEAQHSSTGDAKVVARPGWKNKDGSTFEPTLVQRIDWDDAFLIAAAPELLAICKALVARSHAAVIATTGLGDQLRAAIKKAEGKQ